MYNIAGFSYGSQKALEFALHSKRRINTLILLSPAFFNDKESDFVESQIDAFQKNKQVYMKAFLRHIGYEVQMKPFLLEPNKIKSNDLENLLYYRFKREDLQSLQNRGVEIVVLFGEGDKIINVSIAAEFFREFGIVYVLKNRNHLLEIIS